MNRSLSLKWLMMSCNCLLESNGGQLIIHHESGAAQLILPINLKTVFFQSDVQEHEVAKANRARMSVTGWLKSV